MFSLMNSLGDDAPDEIYNTPGAALASACAGLSRECSPRSRMSRDRFVVVYAELMTFAEFTTGGILDAGAVEVRASGSAVRSAAANGPDGWVRPYLRDIVPSWLLAVVVASSTAVPALGN